MTSEPLRVLNLGALLLVFQSDRREEEEEEDEDEENEFEDSDDDGGGWITPSNIKQIQQELEQCDIPKDVRVGCVTTDFAMQVGGGDPGQCCGVRGAEPL